MPGRNNNMKLQMPKWLVFILGILFACLFFVLPKGMKKETATDDPCDRKIDLALGHDALNGIPIFDKTLQLAASNRVEDAKSLLRNYTWWQLEETWAISKKYDGALDDDLNPLLTNVYPRLRREITFEYFTNFPKDFLTEMSNFVKAADAMTKATNK
jgi:hypothetical protein